MQSLRLIGQYVRAGHLAAAWKLGVKRSGVARQIIQCGSAGLIRRIFDKSELWSEETARALCVEFRTTSNCAVLAVIYDEILQMHQLLQDGHPLPKPVSRIVREGFAPAWWPGQADELIDSMWSAVFRLDGPGFCSFLCSSFESGRAPIADYALHRAHALLGAEGADQLLAGLPIRQLIEMALKSSRSNLLSGAIELALQDNCEPKICLEAAEAALKMNCPGLVVAAMESAIRQECEPPLCIGLAEAAAKIDRPELVESAIQWALQQECAPQICIHLAEAALKVDRPDLVETAIKRALQQECAPQLCIDVAETALKIERPELVVAAVESAVRQKAEPQICIRLGELALNAQRPDLVRAVLDMALEQDCDTAVQGTLVGIVANTGDFTLAQALVREVHITACKGHAFIDTAGFPLSRPVDSMQQLFWSLQRGMNEHTFQSFVRQQLVDDAIASKQLCVAAAVRHSSLTFAAPILAELLHGASHSQIRFEALVALYEFKCRPRITPAMAALYVRYVESVLLHKLRMDWHLPNVLAVLQDFDVAERQDFLTRISFERLVTTLKDAGARYVDAYSNGPSYRDERLSAAEIFDFGLSVIADVLKHAHGELRDDDLQKVIALIDQGAFVPAWKEVEDGWEYAPRGPWDDGRPHKQPKYKKVRDFENDEHCYVDYMELRRMAKMEWKRRCGPASSDSGIDVDLL